MASDPDAKHAALWLIMFLIVIGFCVAALLIWLGAW